MKAKHGTLFLYHILFWSIAYTALSFFKYFDLGEILSFYDVGTSEDHQVLLPMGLSLFAGIIQGFLLALADLWLSGHLKGNRSLLAYLFHKTAAYFLVISVVILISGILRVGIVTSSFSGALRESLILFGSRIVISYLIYALIMSFVASFLYQMFQMVGSHVFYALLKGRYYSPVEENRIFMFLDLESSTTYAERLGHLRFSSLIQDCFSDLDRWVVKYQAQIDQYIGDEAIVTWPIRGGEADWAALDFYYDYIYHLDSRRDYYMDKYGFVPRFKAGVNSGSVTVAEIGVRKRSIAFHGDVLNTAARIQGECNRLKKPLLISQDFFDLVKDCPRYSMDYMESLQLKGKESETAIYSVSAKRNESIGDG